MKKCVFAFILTLCLLLAGCGARGDYAPRSRTVFAMDTVMNLTVYEAVSDVTEHRRTADVFEDALDAVEQELYRLDAELARGTEDSAVYQLNGLGAVNDSTVADLLQESRRINEATDGAFDPTIAPVLELWGFGSGAGEHRVPSEAELAAALAVVGMDNIHIEGAQVALEDGEVDLGGIAKGWAAQRAREILVSSYGVTSAVLDLGGDVCVVGTKPDGSKWRVAIKDPADGGGYLGILETAGDRYVATSGVYERWFEENGIRYHHILDPKTGYPADSGLVSATVVCEGSGWAADGVWADALATAACVLGADKALALRDALPYPYDGTCAVDLILVTDDGRVLYTADGFMPETGNDYAYEKIA